MPLPEPSIRKHVHTRAIDYRGYERKDGLWDIEAHLTDTKTYKFTNKWRGEMEVGEPLHQMLLRVTVDEDFRIRDIVAVTENSPFEMCPNIAPKYKSLIGIKMGPGWRRAIRKRVGGTQGCTHLTELLFPMATVAMQTIWPLIKKPKHKTERKKKSSQERPMILDTCHAWASDSPIVKENSPQYYTANRNIKE
ncbi:MAG: hypothetical protein CMQ41_08690 [Gammaproteobacteria bacterium]|nr:hypothetical protein [Gammaproteobacteria bacterium]MBM88437.1 hypothetical protein [Gammaproteobacteria bacterium]|tara:strand:- start:1309 stop:1887 length:579 start_codon:yes stop_codon:yes gene_type:complete